MLVKTFGSAVYGIDAVTISVEVNVTEGLHTYIVGLPDNAVKESIQRVESAIRTNGFYMPRTKIIVNLAPAGLRKSGAAFDLPIALCILAATEQIPGADHLPEYTIMGELGLGGSITPIKGALPIAIQAKKDKVTGLIIPRQNAKEAGIIKDLPIFSFTHIREVIDFLVHRYSASDTAAAQTISSENTAALSGVILSASLPVPAAGKATTPASDHSACSTSGSVSLRPDLPAPSVAGSPTPRGHAPSVHEHAASSINQDDTDFLDVRGQEFIKRALEIAAAGDHNVVLIGPPGSGKTMLAKRLPSILPPLSLQEALDTTKIHSVAGLLPDNSALITRRPFRSPHHTVSAYALAGGGSIPQPGEMSLAHNGVLFLDELPEFNRSVLEVMRQPMEDGRLTISRAKMTVTFPASFMLLAAMNPCPCGYYSHPEKECVCPPGAVMKYLNKISGPLMDRIDMHIEVVPVPYEYLSSAPAGESSAVIRERVTRCRERQKKRYGTAISNARLTSKMMTRFCILDTPCNELLRKAMDRLHLSARAHDRIIKVARTIADLAGQDTIKTNHLAEAIQYRCLDKDAWGR